MDSFTSQYSLVHRIQRAAALFNHKTLRIKLDAKAPDLTCLSPCETDSGEGSSGEESLSGESDGVPELLQNTEW